MARLFSFPTIRLHVSLHPRPSRPHAARTPCASAVELLSSMRFAISLLTVICIASVIGTVLKQHEPAVNYVNQFGPFWAEVFLAAQAQCGLQRLVVPADPGLPGGQHLAVHRAQHAARSSRDLKAYKENIREQSLQAFHHRAEAALAETPEAAASRIGQTLAGGGWKVQAAAARRRRLDGGGQAPAAPTSWATWRRTAPSCWCAWAACSTAT